MFRNYFHNKKQPNLKLKTWPQQFLRSPDWFVHLWVTLPAFTPVKFFAPGINLIGHPVETGDLRQGDVPCPVGGAVDMLRVDERLAIVEPFGDRFVLVLVQFDLEKGTC